MQAARSLIFVNTNGHDWLALLRGFLDDASRAKRQRIAGDFA
jgi:hypothetical protein